MLGIACYHQGFQDQFAAFDQAILQRQQVVDRRAAVIEHAHGEHRVEAFELLGQLLQRQRQVPGGQVRQVALHGLELAEEQPVGVDADHAFGAGTEHPPLVVAVAATDIQHAPAAQVEVWSDPRPLPVRAPFGVDMHAKQVERPLAPGRQAEQRIAHLLAGGVIAIVIEGEAVQQVDLARQHGRQGVQRRLPTAEVAVADGHLGVQLLLQVIGPVFQGRTLQALNQRG